MSPPPREGAIDPIAERSLKLGEGDVTVTIGRPEPWAGDFFCRYRIEGADLKITSRAMGFDGVQALQLALRMVAPELKSVERKSEVGIVWPLLPSGGTGFTE